jgi:multidrug resistance efflux pump
MPVESQPPGNTNPPGSGGGVPGGASGNSPVAPRRRILRRVIRIALGLALIAIAGWLATAWLLTPSLWTITSNQAVVNAQIRSLHSPIEGIVKTQPPAVGKAVTAGSPLLTIENSLVDDSHLEELKTEAASLAERVVALRSQHKVLENLKERMSANARNYHEAAVRRLQRQVEEAKSLAAAAEALAKQRDYKKDQLAKLVGGLNVSQLEMVTAGLAREAAKSKAAQASFTVSRLTEELQSVREGSFTGFVDGRNDVPYSEQRVHEIDILQNEITAKIQEHSTRHAQIEKQLRIEQERLKRQAGYRLNAPIDGIVWRQPVTAGTPIIRETELLQLLDRKEIFVDALVNGKYFGAIQPGDPVLIKLIGSHADVEGVVKDIVGQVALGDEHSLAAMVPKPAKQEIHVLVSFASGPGSTDNFQSYHIGQPVEVRFSKSRGFFGRLWDLVSP